MRTVCALLILSLFGCASAPPAIEAPPLFVFQSNMWLNLHHFARAVARGMPVSASLSAEEQRTWDEGIAFYKQHYANRDLLQDQGMVAIKEVLRKIPVAEPLPSGALDPALRSTLERLAPIYRAHWWTGHDHANRDWIVAVQPLVKTHGQQLSASLTRALDATWPSTPIPVDLSVQAGPVGAYTTSPPASTISSSEASYRGLAALEMVFHEPSHAWGKQLAVGIATAAEARNRKVPPQLWHAVLFYNAGELTRRTLEQAGVLGYVDYATKHDLYRDLCGEGCRARVEAAWSPRLDGKVTIPQALDALVASWPPVD